MAATLKQRAFGLLETLLAVSLLALSVLLLCGVLISALRLSGQNRDASAAAQSAQQIFEQIRGGAFPPPAGSVVFDGAAGDSKVAGFPPDPYPSQTLDGRLYTYRVDSKPVGGQPGLFDISITVNWSGGHQVQMETQIYVP